MPRHLTSAITVLPKFQSIIGPTVIQYRQPRAALQTRLCATHVVGVGPTIAPAKAKISAFKKPNWTAPKPPAPNAPLSVLPVSALLRSLLITTVSSKPWLLRPTLHVLSFLVKAPSKFLFNVDKNPVLYTILRKTFYDQFCAGETAEETRACVKGLKKLGFRGVILTYAKETVFDHLTKTLFGHSKDDGSIAAQLEHHDSEIEDWRTGVLKTASMIGAGDYLAIKLTGAGTSVTSALAAGNMPPQQMMDALDEIATGCAHRGVKIIVDAESQHFQRQIDVVALDLMRKYNREGFAAIYNTYQAYLKSTSSNIANHLSAASQDGFTLGLKLVRGAYISSENRGLIHNTKSDTDDAYNSIAQGAVRRQFDKFGGTGPGSLPFPSVDLFLASHNRESLVQALRLHRQMTRAEQPTVPIAFGQLHGMSDELSFSLLQDGLDGDPTPDVFKCSTWGSMGECLAYLLRRATENRDAVLRTLDERDAVRQECRRRWKSMFSVQT